MARHAALMGETPKPFRPCSGARRAIESGLSVSSVLHAPWPSWLGRFLFVVPVLRLARLRIA